MLLRDVLKPLIRKKERKNTEYCISIIQCKNEGHEGKTFHSTKDFELLDYIVAKYGDIEITRYDVKVRGVCNEKGKLMSRIVDVSALYKD